MVLSRVTHTFIDSMNVPSFRATIDLELGHLGSELGLAIGSFSEPCQVTSNSSFIKMKGLKWIILGGPFQLKDTPDAAD